MQGSFKGSFKAYYKGSIRVLLGWGLNDYNMVLAPITL